MSKPKSSKQIAREIDKSFKANMKLLLASMEGLEPSSRAYLDRLIAKTKMEQAHREERFLRGVDPRDLGAIQQVTYTFRATSEAPASEPFDAKRQQLNEELDALYPSATPAPAPAPTKPKGRK